jgi:biopolymer transport protein ExbB/TolQ
MRVGNEVILTDTQNDVVHAGVHMASVAEGLAALQQGGNPQEILVYAMAVLQHTGQHLQRIANDPLRQAEFEQLRQRFEGLQEQMEELGGLLEQAQAGEQQQAMAAQEAQMVQQGLDPKTQIKQAEAQQKMSISQQRAQNEMELSRMRTEHQMRLQDALTANTIRNQNKV